MKTATEVNVWKVTLCYRHEQVTLCIVVPIGTSMPDVADIAIANLPKRDGKDGSPVRKGFHKLEAELVKESSFLLMESVA